MVVNGEGGRLSPLEVTEPERKSPHTTQIQTQVLPRALGSSVRLVSRGNCNTGPQTGTSKSEAKV